MEHLRYISEDKEKGDLFYCKYNSKGQLLKYYILNTHLSIQYCKYCDILSDLLEAKQAVRSLISRDDFESENAILIRALFDYCLTLIVRCFNSSKGRKTRLDCNTPQK